LAPQDAPNPLTRSWQPWQIEVVRGLHQWSISSHGVNQQLARWLGLPSSDATALSHVVWDAEAGTPISPVALSRRMGMTSGATTLLVDRLEAAGHVTRSRESTDRRRVTLRPTDRARRQFEDFLEVAGAEVADVLEQTDPDELVVVARFLDAMDRANRASATHVAALLDAR